MMDNSFDKQDYVNRDSEPSGCVQPGSTENVSQSPLPDTPDNITPQSDAPAQTEPVSSDTAYTAPAGFTDTAVPAAPLQSPTYQPLSYQSSAPVTPVNAYQSAQPRTPYTSQDNGYYQPSMPPVPPAPPIKPKRSKGATAFLICMWSLLGLFSLGFFVLCGYTVGQANSSGNTVQSPFVEQTEPTKAFDATSPSNASDPTINAVPKPDNSEIYSSTGKLTLNPQPADKDNSDKYDTQYSYAAVSASSVGIVCYSDSVTTYSNAASQGSGIVISSDGYVVTNSHVIGDSKTTYNIQVIFSDTKAYDAIVVGFDSRTDIAVLKIDAKGLTAAEFGDSELLSVGEDVIAIGNPGGIDFQNSLTRGVVSAKDRRLDLSTQVSYIQTDAAINPGNSGGALCNLYGQVVGINSAKISSSSYEGMGFAIPSRTVKEIVDDLTSQGYVGGRVRIGVSGSAVSAQSAKYYNVPRGILVSEIDSDGPCADTELKVNDIITEVSGNEITSFQQMYTELSKHSAGDKIELTIYRDSTSKTFTMTVTLQADEGQSQE